MHIRYILKRSVLKISKFSISRRIVFSLSLFLIISSVLYLLYVVFSPKKEFLPSNNRILSKDAKVLFENGIISGSTSEDIFRYSLSKSNVQNIAVLQKVKEVEGVGNYEILNSVDIRSEELYKNLDEFQLYGVFKHSDDYSFLVLKSQTNANYKLYSLNKTFLFNNYSAKLASSFQNETLFYFSQKEGNIKILNEQNSTANNCLVQIIINPSTKKSSTKNLPCGFEKITVQNLDYYFTVYNKSKHELFKYNLETEQISTLGTFDNHIYHAKLNISDQGLGSRDFLVEELSETEPLKNLNVATLEEKIVKPDLEKSPLEIFKIDDWYGGFSANYLGVSRTGVILYGEINSEKNYTLVTNKESKIKKEFVVDGSNYPDFYKSLNYLLNISRLRNANTGGGGGSFTGVHVSFIEQPKNNLEVILFYVDYSKFSSPNYDGKSILAFQKFLYDKEKNLVFKSDLKNFYFDRKPQIYSGLSFYKYSPDLSSAILKDSGGDGCGGGVTYYYFEGEKIVSDKEFTYGCGGGNNVYKDSNDLIYYGNSVSLYESKVDFTDVDYDIFSNYLKEKNLENYGVSTFNTYTNIRKYDILTQDDALFLGFEKYKTNSSDLVLVLSWENDSKEPNPNTLKFLIFNAIEKKIKKLINYNILSGEVVLD